MITSKTSDDYFNVYTIRSDCYCFFCSLALALAFALLYRSLFQLLCGNDELPCGLIQYLQLISIKI